MTLEQVLAFNLVLAAAIASPGPALLMAVQTSLSAGRRAGIALGAGLGCMAAAWTGMALLGLGAVFRLFPAVHTAAKVAGAAYLVWLAWRMWRDSSAPVEARMPAAARAFRQGFLVNLLNPKSVLFAAAVLVTVFPAGLNAAESALIVANHFLVEIAFYSTLAFCMSTQAVAKRYLRAKRHIDRAAALILGGLGLRLLLGREAGPP